MSRWLLAAIAFLVFLFVLCLAILTILDVLANSAPYAAVYGFMSGALLCVWLWFLHEWRATLTDARKREG